MVVRELATLHPTGAEKQLNSEGPSRDATFYQGTDGTVTSCPPPRPFLLSLLSCLSPSICDPLCPLLWVTMQCLFCGALCWLNWIVVWTMGIFHCNARNSLLFFLRANVTKIQFLAWQTGHTVEIESKACRVPLSHVHPRCEVACRTESCQFPWRLQGFLGDSNCVRERTGCNSMWKTPAHSRSQCYIR